MDKITKIIATSAHEGPAWSSTYQRLYFTTKPDFIQNIPSRVAYWDANNSTIARTNFACAMPNDLTFDSSGQLLVAEQGSFDQCAGISKIDIKHNQRKILIDNYQGTPFNCPNKVVSNKKGIIYFTDPAYGFYQGFRQHIYQPPSIYAYDIQTGDCMRLATTNICMPHGIALSLDESKLYVVDNGPIIDEKNLYDKMTVQKIYAIKLETPTKITNIQCLIEINPPVFIDGLIVDEHDELFFTNHNSIMHYNNQGKLIKSVSYDAERNINFFNLTKVDNLCFITGDSGIYQMRISNC